MRWRLFVQAYPWRRVHPVPWTPLLKPLAECRVALVSSAGFVLPGQELFDRHRRGGDPTFREVPGDVDVTSLVDSHRSEAFDHTGMLRDPNLAFPVDRLRELAMTGRIGSVNRRQHSFMGSLTATGRLARHTAPEATRTLMHDGVDVALLVPVGPMCNQAVGLVAAELERQGVATVAVQLLREVALRVRPPRALLVPFPHGYPLDAPGQPARQHAVIEAALRLLEEQDWRPPMLVEYGAESANADERRARW